MIKIFNFIRGLAPYPAAWTELVSPEGTHAMLKIYSTEKRPSVHHLPVGTISSDGKNYIDVSVSDGFIRLLSLQLAGKKRLSVQEFLNGFKSIAECHLS